MGDMMRIYSPDIKEGGPIPQKFTADGEDVSPKLVIEEVPENAKSLALICDDPDAPSGTWVHWVLWDIPPDVSELEEGADIGASGKNDFGKNGYGGPSPPPGKPHRYFFRLFALDQMLELPGDTTKAGLEDAMKGHVLAATQFFGTYGR